MKLPALIYIMYLSVIPDPQRVRLIAGKRVDPVGKLTEYTLARSSSS